MSAGPGDRPIVIDASIAVGAATGDPVAERSLLTWTTAGRRMVAPGHLWIETANALVRARRMSAADTSAVLSALTRVGIGTVDRGLQGLDAAEVLAARHRVTVYDAAYLWLAMEVDGELATFDRALIDAARAEGVALAIRL